MTVGAWGGGPPRGLGGGLPAPPWATAAAVGPGGERWGGGGGGGGGDTPRDYTKPQKIAQSLDRLYKDIKYCHVDLKCYTFDQKY